MNTIPTAEKFLKDCQLEGNWTAKRMLIEFAKLHVQEVLKEVDNKLEYFEGCDRIEDLYPLTNIK